MALKGSFTGYTNNSRVEPKITWSATQDIAGNYSDVTAILTYSRTNSGYTTSGTWSGSIIINGTTVTDSKSISITQNSNTEAMRATVRVYHNSNGRKSIDIECTGTISAASITYTTCSATIALDDIPRAAQVLTAPNFNDEENPTITYTNPADSVVDKIEAGIYEDKDNGGNALAAYRSIAVDGSTYTFELTAQERENLRKSVTSGYTKGIRFYLRTTIGSEYFYHNLPKTLTLINAAPTISPIITDINEATNTLTNDVYTFVKGFSNADVFAGVQGRKEASIDNSKIRVTNGESYINGGVGELLGVTTDTFTITATDSRGNTTTKDFTYNFIDYFAPTCSQKLAIALSGETEAKVTLTISGKWFNSSFGAAGVQNELKLFVRHTQNDGTMGDWVELTQGLIPTVDGNKYELTTTISGFDYNGEFTFECYAADLLAASAPTAPYVVKLIPTFNWGKDYFNFNVPVSINNQQIVDYIVEEGTEDIWSWRKWASGKAECWGKWNLGNMAVTSAWGSMYESAGFSKALPNGVFTEAPTVLNIDIMSSNGNAFVARGYGNAPTASNTGSFYIVRPLSGNMSQVTVSFYAMGK